ncbi:cytochrome c551/cytochrome c550 [Bacillus oleivorans]|uniref:Cytochrome c551/cytochrome c550 n=1 Tax=Bacillus oleivorans TaxID=1448271 RepID=A0A285CZ48_9BACI|nr:cytochrome c [Bacillus oleivorans]SNX72820.1 cytochrome c551/cytochrome c550 [Bacillus oleivorans]
MPKKLFSFFILFMLALAACGGGEEEETNQENGADTSAIEAQARPIYEQNCLQCHGQNLEGTGGPSLQKVGSKYSQAEIEEIILEGKGTNMPGGLIQGDEAAAVAEWLSTLK